MTWFTPKLEPGAWLVCRSPKTEARLKRVFGVDERWPG